MKARRIHLRKSIRQPMKPEVLPKAKNLDFNPNEPLNLPTYTTLNDVLKYLIPLRYKEGTQIIHSFRQRETMKLSKLFSLKIKYSVNV